MALAEFLSAFGVPATAEPVVDDMISLMEQDFLLGLPQGRSFTVEEAIPLLVKTAGREVDKDEANPMLRLAYERGQLDLLSEDGPVHYQMADFFTFLDVFATGEPARWAALPVGIRRALDDAYLTRYVEGFTKSPERSAAGGSLAPWAEEDGAEAGQRHGEQASKWEMPYTEDEVLPVDEVVERILADGRPLYLSPCDCRALHGHALEPGGLDSLSGDRTEPVCLSYRTAPGSFASRGLSRRITREEGAAIVRAADRDGLVHTANPGGICNCCTDCCYLLRGRERLGTGDAWPIVRYKAVLDEAACTGCGICETRCPFGALTLPAAGETARFVREKCLGCGLCTSTCPAGALALHPPEGPVSMPGRCPVL